MSGLLSFLLFGALFFVMMRFGCGAHVSHGGHGGHPPQCDNNSDPKSKNETRPPMRNTWRTAITLKYAPAGARIHYVELLMASGP